MSTEPVVKTKKLDHKIAVTIWDGKMTLSSKSLRILQGDQVRWEARAEEFFIRFNSRSPFTLGTKPEDLELTPDQATGYQTAIQSGTFEYVVLSYPQKKVYADPEVVVDPPPYP